MTASTLTFKPIPKVNENFFSIDETEVLYQNPVAPNQYKNFPTKKIIINRNSGLGISIVKNNFLSVRHQDAFNLGLTLFEMLFGVSPDIHKESINTKKTDYSVDLVSENCKIIFDRNGYRFYNSLGTILNGTENNNPTENPDNASRATRGLGFISENFRDQYHPFIRVSNYLREGNAFYIELGYYRYRCSNGMMLGRKTQTTFRHSYYVNSFKSIQIAVMEQFLRHKHSFMYMAENLWKLLLVYIPKAKMRLTSFDIFEKELLRRSIEERMELQLKLNELIDKYVLEIGENLNAALNVATDFSKLLEGNKVSQSHIQNLGSIWANRVSERSFNIEKYFADLSDIEERIMTHQINIEEEELI